MLSTILRALALLLTVGTAACASQSPAPANDTDPRSLPRPLPRPLGASARPADPLPGEEGAGDPYFPTSGNGGYDVQHYDLVLDVSMPEGFLKGEARVRARALHDLSRFNLDLFGLEVGSVRVDGAVAGFEREGRELIITPAAPCLAETVFTVTIEYSGKPALAPDPSVAAFAPGVGWWHQKSGIFVMSECIGAPSWFPCNDHPTDKATFAITVTVPEPFVAAANGILVDDRALDGQRTFVWSAKDPMATYLATVNIAEFAMRVEVGPHGMPLRLFYPKDAKPKALAAFDRTGEMIEYFEGLFGPYPFESFGGVLSADNLAGALETQTLPVYSRGASEIVVAHELAHQWFGNCVSPERWSDLWVSEGFATYAEWLWAEHTQGEEALEKKARRAYRQLTRRNVGSPVDPGVGRIFSARTYTRAGFMLHRLRREVGDEPFFALLKRWIVTYHDATAGTGAFVAMASDEAGRDLGDFFEAFLFSDELPELEEYASGEQGRGH